MSKVAERNIVLFVVVTIISFVVFGAGWLTVRINQGDAAEADRTCGQIAQLAESNQWQRSGLDTCYIVKDSKLVKVKI